MPAAFRMHRLEIEGFKAFAAPQSLEIGGHVFVFGRNGLGKSSVVEAIRWCLFGLADRPEVEVRNVFYPLGDCRVELQLDGPGGRWSVQRRLRPGSGRSDLTIQDPSGVTVPQSKVFPNLARLGPREGTHIIFAAQQSIHRRPQADITDFDKVLYSYLKIDDVPDLLDRVHRELEEQEAIERQLAEKLNNAEESLRSKLSDLRSRIEENLAAKPWPGEQVPTNAETDTRIRAFVKECGACLERSDGGTVTRGWLLEEAKRAIEELSETTKDAVQRNLAKARDAHRQLESDKETYDELTKQLKREQARIKSCESDLTNALRGTTKQQLLKDCDKLVRKDRKLARYLELVRQAVGYFEEFSPEECPVCDEAVNPTDVLSRLHDQTTSDRHAAELSEVLKSVQTRLREIDAAEEALETARLAGASVESEVAAARIRLGKLVDDPADLSSSSRAVERLAERIRLLERELTESGTLVASRRSTLRNLDAETRFQTYRSREEKLIQDLESGLEPAREAHRELADVLDTLRNVREALQGSFNVTLNGTLANINTLMTEVFGRLTQQASFPKIVVESGPADEKRTLCMRVTSDHTPGKSFEPSEVLNGQAFNAVNLVPYFVFSHFQAEAFELDCLLIDDPSQSFDTSRVELLMHELATAATHAQLIVASHEEDRFKPFIESCFPPGSYRVLRVTSFSPNLGPTLECGA